jgi:hypothetical protein
MDEQTWNMLACSMALLTESVLSLTAHGTVALAEQLLYLAHGEQALSELAQDQETPPPEDLDIPHELWEVLQKIPLSLEYYKMIKKSLQTHPKFWGEVATPDSGGFKDFSDFPWREDEDSTDLELGLDDYVMLKCLNEASWLAKLSNLMEALIEPMSVPLLSEVLSATQHATHPILLVYEEACPRSQALLYALEEKITEILKVCCIV